MSQDSPVAVLYDHLGNELAVQNGVAIPVSTPGIMLLGSDGVDSRYLLVDNLGRPIIVGAGTAGSPAGGVVSVQGVASGTPLPISAASLPLPTGAATEVTLASRLADATFTARINTLGQKSMANSTPVVIASDQSAIPVTVSASSTSSSSATSQVGASTSNVTILAANAARRGATIYNDSTKLLYLKLGATATLTDFTTILRQGDYYEVPFGYVGIIDGLWSGVNGAARVTELT